MNYTKQHEMDGVCISSHPSDDGFIGLLDRYRPTGGIANAGELARRQGHCEDSGMNTLLKLILASEIFSFEWQGNFWIPLFQFNPKELTSRHCVRQVLGELTNVFDGWTLAVWFVQSNASLRYRKPIDLLEEGLSSVLTAARADRHVVSV